jgi:hypothetical protein
VASDCSNLQQLIHGFSLIEECDQVRNNAFRLATPFRYPNGSKIDVFLYEKSTLIREYALSDFGQTTEYLLDLQIKPWTTKKRRQAIDDICDILDVHINGSQLEIHLTESELPKLSEAIVRLVQACIRMADLSLTQKLHSPNLFKEDVEEFIESLDVPYETDKTIPGRFETDVKIDFSVEGKRTRSLVQALSTPNSQLAHSMANEVFRRWYDITDVKPHYSFITVLDSTVDGLRDDDYARLGELSSVIGFPAQAETLQATLLA